jgi:hypothetical protein
VWYFPIHVPVKWQAAAKAAFRGVLLLDPKQLAHGAVVVVDMQAFTAATFKGLLHTPGVVAVAAGAGADLHITIKAAKAALDMAVL